MKKDGSLKFLSSSKIIKSLKVVVNGLVAQITSPGIFYRGLKSKSVHHNYQIIEKKNWDMVWLIRKHLPSRFKRRMTWIIEHMFGVNMSNCEVNQVGIQMSVTARLWCVTLINIAVCV